MYTVRIEIFYRRTIRKLEKIFLCIEIQKEKKFVLFDDQVFRKGCRYIAKQVQVSSLHDSPVYQTDVTVMQPAHQSITCFIAQTS